METLNNVLNILTIVVPLLVSLAGFITSAIAYFKTKGKAERAAAFNDLYQHGLKFVQDIETSFDSFNKMLKSQGSSAGPMKKEQVMTRLQNYALQQGYEFDEEFWSAEIDNIVAFTREVNAKK